MSESSKVARIREHGRKLREAAANPDHVQQSAATEPVHQSGGRIIEVIDRVLDTSDEAAPVNLVAPVLAALTPAETGELLREAVRVFVEVRIHERQGEPTSVHTDSGKVRENRLRRVASRRGLRLKKSPRRDPQAVDYGTYQIIDRSNNALIANGIPLDEVEQHLGGA